jgi:hypothetical protein
MVWEGLMFNDQNTDSLFEWGAFQSKYVSKIEERASSFLVHLFSVHDKSEIIIFVTVFLNISISSTKTTAPAH